mgnify:FL=1
MKKFIVIYHTPTEAAKQMAGKSQEDMAKGMEAWMIWAKKCGDALVDMGSPLMGGQVLSPNGTTAPSTKEVNGYSIVQAANMKAAVALFNGHPHLTWNDSCSIEFHEVMPLPGM